MVSEKYLKRVNDCLKIINKNQYVNISCEVYNGDEDYITFYNNNKLLFSIDSTEKSTNDIFNILLYVSLVIR